MSKRKVIHSEGREIIAKVFHFLRDEYNFMKENNSDKCDLSPLANVLRRTAEATGVSERTVSRILKEEKELPSSKFTSPMKRRRKKDGNLDNKNPKNNELQSEDEEELDTALQPGSNLENTTHNNSKEIDIKSEHLYQENYVDVCQKLDNIMNTHQLNIKSESLDEDQVDIVPKRDSNLDKMKCETNELKIKSEIIDEDKIDIVPKQDSTLNIISLNTKIKTENEDCT